MRRIILIICLLLPILTYAKNLGYGKTEWGMTPEQVINVEKDRAKLIEAQQYLNSWGKVGIDTVIIAGDKYKVLFIFDHYDKLIQVNISSIEPYIPSLINF